MACLIRSPSPTRWSASHRLLNEAADAVEASDWEFAKYLRNRARDLLSDDYESGDAAWITGRFKHLNAQIGAYESYDDELLGNRAFYALSLLAERTAEGAALREAMEGMQALEDMLPYERHKKVVEDIPVGVYDVIADFGQARGGNTATNLPNEAYLAKRYGSIILLRANIMRNPEIFQGSGDIWRASVAPQFAGDLNSDGNFYRTLWHEVGHYLGPDLTAGGRELDAIGADANLLEELKADLVSLFLARELRRRDYYNPVQLRSVYASGILRTLQNNRPRREQPYNMMQLMQWNWFLDRGVLRFDPASGKLSIDYDKYPRRGARHAAPGDRASGERRSGRRRRLRRLAGGIGTRRCTAGSPIDPRPAALSLPAVRICSLERGGGLSLKRDGPTFRATFFRARADYEGMGRKQNENEAAVWETLDAAIASASETGRAILITCRDGPVAILQPPDYRVEALSTSN